jgi:integrase
VNRFNFTKAALNDLRVEGRGRKYFYDTKVHGLSLAVTASGTKSFVLYRWALGKPQKITLGRYPDLSIEQARGMASEANSKLAQGINPKDERRAKLAKSVTLGQAFEEYQVSRKNLSPRTLYDYQRILESYFWDWRERPIAAITKDMVEQRHRQIAEGFRVPSKKGQDGWVVSASEARANYAMRFLRAVINFAMVKYEDSNGKPLLPGNPVKRLSQARAWYRVDRRQTVIRQHQLPDWFKAVLELKSDAVNGKAEVVRDYLLFLILTGVRRSEAAMLKKQDVDLMSRTFTLTDTKNKEQHTLPVSDYLYELLARRVAADDGVYVFPGAGRHGYLVEPKKQVAKVIEASGVPFTLHDLRRTFISVAESLDIPAYALKRLLNHKMRNDVTAGYIVTDVERLRRPMQLVTDYILKSADMKTSADVVEIASSRRESS